MTIDMPHGEAYTSGMTEHRIQLREVGTSSYYAMCICGWIGPAMHHRGVARYTGNAHMRKDTFRRQYLTIEEFDAAAQLELAEALIDESEDGTIATLFGQLRFPH